MKTQTSNVPAGGALAKDALNRANTPLANYRQTRAAPDLMRYLAAGNALASTALLNLVALADTGIQIKAYDSLSSEFSREGLLAAELIVSGINTSADYSRGYANKRSMPCLIESLLREVSLTGGCCVELVLDRYRIPDRLEIFDYSEITWISDGKGGKYPQQKPKSGEPVDLNYPTVFIGESFKSAAEKYATPFSVSGAQSLFQLESFLEDSWRVIRRAGEPRLTASLDYESIVRSAPADVQNDPVKLADYLESARTQIETLLTGLNPEDALITYSQVTVDKIDAGNEKRDFSELMQVYTGMAASALKSNASLLGLRSASGSQNVASTESLFSCKVARRLQLPVEEVLSRALTLAVKLYGVDAYVSVEFKTIELRPETELEAFKAMQQARVMQLLSWGRILDSEAQAMLGLGSLPESAAPLSGTGFYNAPAVTPPPAGDGAIGQNVGQPGGTSAGGADQEQRP